MINKIENKEDLEKMFSLFCDEIYFNEREETEERKKKVPGNNDPTEGKRDKYKRKKP